jgi:hypothetical protein
MSCPIGRPVASVNREQMTCIRGVCRILRARTVSHQRYSSSSSTPGPWPSFSGPSTSAPILSGAVHGAREGIEAVHLARIRLRGEVRTDGKASLERTSLAGVGCEGKSSPCPLALASRPSFPLLTTSLTARKRMYRRPV